MQVLTTFRYFIVVIALLLVVTGCGGGGGGSSSEEGGESADTSGAVWVPNPDCPDVSQSTLSLYAGCPEDEGNNDSDDSSTDDTDIETPTDAVDSTIQEGINRAAFVDCQDSGNWSRIGLSRTCRWQAPDGGVDVHFGLDSYGVVMSVTRDTTLSFAPSIYTVNKDGAYSSGAFRFYEEDCRLCNSPDSTVFAGTSVEIMAGDRVFAPVEKLREVDGHRDDISLLSFSYREFDGALTYVVFTNIREYSRQDSVLCDGAVSCTFVSLDGESSVKINSIKELAPNRRILEITVNNNTGEEIRIVGSNLLSVVTSTYLDEIRSRGAIAKADQLDNKYIEMNIPIGSVEMTLVVQPRINNVVLHSNTDVELWFYKAGTERQELGGSRRKIIHAEYDNVLVQ